MQVNVIINRRHASDVALWRLAFRLVLTYGSTIKEHIKDVNTQTLLEMIYHQMIILNNSIKKSYKESSSTGSSRVRSIFDTETVLESLLSYLDFKSLCKVSTLNKHWYKLATSEAVWERLTYKDFNVCPRLSYKYSHIGAGRSKDVYCYSMRLFKYSVYGFGKKGGNAK